MDVSFQPKSTQPEDAKKGIVLADILAMYKGERKSILVILLTVVLVVVVVFIFVIIGMKSSLEAKVASKNTELQQKDATMPIKPTNLPEMAKVSNRIRIVTDVVKGHPYMTTFLKLLEYSVEDDVIFGKTDIAATRSQGGETYIFTITAQARNYAAVLNQIQTLRDQEPYKKFFSNIEMDSFGVGKKGEISFKINGKASVKGLPPEEVEAQLLKVLDKSDLPEQGAINSLPSQPASSTTP